MCFSADWGKESSPFAASFGLPITLHCFIPQLLTGSNPFLHKKIDPDDLYVQSLICFYQENIVKVLHPMILKHFGCFINLSN